MFKGMNNSGLINLHNSLFFERFCPAKSAFRRMAVIYRNSRLFLLALMFVIFLRNEKSSFLPPLYY